MVLSKGRANNFVIARRVLLGTRRPIDVPAAAGAGTTALIGFRPHLNRAVLKRSRISMTGVSSPPPDPAVSICDALADHYLVIADAEVDESVSFQFLTVGTA